MTILEAMEARHSVRSYRSAPLDAGAAETLRQAIDTCNKEGGLHIQLVTGDPKAFDTWMAHYGKFSGVQHYIALIGPKGDQLDEKLGYYGQRLVLLAQTLGLNTCWVAMTYSKIKTAFQIDAGEKLCLVISIGYGQTQGVPHQSKPRESVMKVESNPPAWFLQGIDAALLAPTAMNQQKFTFSLQGNTVSAKAGIGFYSKIDLGIAKYHFEVGAGKENLRWA